MIDWVHGHLRRNDGRTAYSFWISQGRTSRPGCSCRHKAVWEDAAVCPDFLLVRVAVHRLQRFQNRASKSAEGGGSSTLVTPKTGKVSRFLGYDASTNRAERRRGCVRRCAQIGRITESRICERQTPDTHQGASHNRHRLCPAFCFGVAVVLLMPRPPDECIATPDRLQFTA